MGTKIFFIKTAFRKGWPSKHGVPDELGLHSVEVHLSLAVDDHPVVAGAVVVGGEEMAVTFVAVGVEMGGHAPPRAATPPAAPGTKGGPHALLSSSSVFYAALTQVFQRVVTTSSSNEVFPSALTHTPTPPGRGKVLSRTSRYLMSSRYPVKQLPSTTMRMRIQRWAGR